MADGQAIGEVYPKTKTPSILTNGTDWGLNGDTYESSLKDSGDDLTFTVIQDTTFTVAQDTSSHISTNLDDQNTVPALLNLEWTADNEYPADYIKQLNQWADIADTTMVLTSSTSSPSPMPTAPTGPQISQHCIGLGSNKYLAQPQLAENIKDFCSQAVRQGVQDTNSGSIFRLFNQGVGQDQNLQCIAATVLTSFCRRSMKLALL